MDHDTFIHDRASSVEVAAMVRIAEMQFPNMHTVVSNLMGGLIMYEGESTDISELMQENTKLKEVFRRLKNSELQHAYEVRAVVTTSSRTQQ
jgi:hypothetical protein